jgi:hypothetical protein
MEISANSAEAHPHISTLTEVASQALHASATSDTKFLTIVVDPELEAVLGITQREARQGRLAQLLAQADLPRRAAGNSDLRQLLEALQRMS